MLNLVKTLNEFETARKELKGTIGLVPTMGNLHEGHLSLIKESLKENDHTIVTVFVNPKQFAPGEDFDNYPRTLEDDAKKIESLLDGKAVLLFAPDNNEEIYPEGFKENITASENLKNKLCGSSRTNHFDGVCTVVKRLFDLTKPSTSYFGQKDFQQFKIIEEMTNRLELGIQLKMMPIIREQSGLALSSRNQYLSAEEKDHAHILIQTLKTLEILLQSNLEEALNRRRQLQKKYSFEYLEILNAKDLSDDLEQADDLLVACAHKVGKTRLIDNVVVKRC